MVKDNIENISVIEDLLSCYFCHSFMKYNEETGEQDNLDKIPGGYNIL